MTVIAIIVGTVILCVNVGLVVGALCTRRSADVSYTSAKLPRRKALDFDDPQQRREFEGLPR
jgi:hypothetical protein